MFNIKTKKMLLTRRVVFITFIFLFSGCGLVKVAEAPADRAGFAVNALKKTEDTVDEARRSQLIQLTVDFGIDESGISQYAPTEKFELQYTDDLNAFSVLELAGLDVDVKEYDFGNFISSIEGVDSGTDDRYWVYYVNGELGKSAADKYLLNQGDKVEWKFEKSIYEN